MNPDGQTSIVAFTPLKRQKNGGSWKHQIWRDYNLPHMNEWNKCKCHISILFSTLLSFIWGGFQTLSDRWATTLLWTYWGLNDAISLSLSMLLLTLFPLQLLDVTIIMSWFVAGLSLLLFEIKHNYHPIAQALMTPRLALQTPDHTHHCFDAVGSLAAPQLFEASVWRASFLRALRSMTGRPVTRQRGYSVKACSLFLSPPIERIERKPERDSWSSFEVFLPNFFSSWL